MTAAQTYLFPGQGAQAIGMAVDLAARYPRAKRVFDVGAEILGRDILSVCRNGPEEELSSTRTSQPAIFLHSMAVLSVLAKDESTSFAACLPAFAAAGLSLGEYSALVFAGSVDFEEAVRIVGLRGQYMQEACDVEKGGMASILGLAPAKIEEVIEAARSDGLRIGIANYNSPEQTVISGAMDALDESIRRLEAAGARRAIRLKVAGAYHSPLMAIGTRKLEPHLKALKIRPPRLPFYSNVTGSEITDPEEIRTSLIRQIENSVRWEQILRALLARGMSRAYEIGPGKVLAGLMKGISKEVEVTSLGTVEQLTKLSEGAAAVLSPGVAGTQ